jgi:general secretion pathway protein H
VVLAVISIVAAIVTGYTPTRGASRNLKLETYRLEMDLRSARSRAVYDGTPVGFSIDVGSNAWHYADQPAHKVAEGISLTVRTGRRLLSGGSTGRIEFFPNGQSSGGRVTLQSNVDSSEVNIDWLTGRIQPASNDR